MDTLQQGIAEIKGFGLLQELGVLHGLLRGSLHEIFVDTLVVLPPPGGLSFAKNPW